MSLDADIVAAVRRSDRALAEQITQWESLEFGVAHFSADHRDLPAANQLREVWLADLDPATVYDRAEAFYNARDLVCHAWTAASGQAVEPVEQFLIGRGWRKLTFTAMHLASWDAAASRPPPANLRILPARAMPKAFRQTFADAGPSGELLARAAIDRLNDADHDVCIAMCDGVPAGRATYLQVGDIARLDDVFVATPFHRRGVGHALIAHLLQLARRLLPKVVVAAVADTNRAGISFLQSCGFASAGSLCEFHRPG